MLKKFIFSLTAVIALSVVAMAQEGTNELTGPIVDNACATGKVAKQSDPQKAAENETKGCVMMKNCLESGLGVYAGGKYYKFDEKGNALAKAALEKSKKDKGAKFKVSGKVTGDKVAVSSISELE
jgi:hypothetical protein